MEGYYKPDRSVTTVRSLLDGLSSPLGYFSRY